MITRCMSCLVLVGLTLPVVTQAQIFEPITPLSPRSMDECQQMADEWWKHIVYLQGQEAECDKQVDTICKSSGYGTNTCTQAQAGLGHQRQGSCGLLVGYKRCERQEDDKVCATPRMQAAFNDCQSRVQTSQKREQEIAERESGEKAEEANRARVEKAEEEKRADDERKRAQGLRTNSSTAEHASQSIHARDLRKAKETAKSVDKSIDEPKKAESEVEAPQQRVLASTYVIQPPPLSAEEMARIWAAERQRADNARKKAEEERLAVEQARLKEIKTVQGKLAEIGGDPAFDEDADVPNTPVANSRTTANDSADGTKRGANLREDDNTTTEQASNSQFLGEAARVKAKLKEIGEDPTFEDEQQEPAQIQTSKEDTSLRPGENGSSSRDQKNCQPI